MYNMECFTEYMFKCFLFIALCILLVQVYSFEEKFNAKWDPYGTSHIFNEPMLKSTGTTRLEYDYVKRPYPFKNRKDFSLKPISPVTTRQIALRQHYLNKV